ncbi:hypothetical protein [Burkholderia ubonensis]|uniref:hypothetical protein n=1 Tax=Burkholderia ubonensis TaxID=101571 RepID=UPI001E57B9AF|nr:hypothetical protein [Burkholderia ubonensis]
MNFEAAAFLPVHSLKHFPASSSPGFPLYMTAWPMTRVACRIMSRCTKENDRARQDRCIRKFFTVTGIVSDGIG